MNCFAIDPNTAKLSRDAAPSDLVYAAVGGSWATGLPNSAELHPNNPCGQHNSSYPVQFSSQLQINPSNFHFIACAADDLFAVIWSQVPRIPVHANFVSISAGLDFIGFGDVVQACDVEADAEACAGALNRARYAVYVEDKKSNLFRGVHGLVSAIQQRAPQATVVVLGFPRWLGSPVESCHKYPGPDGSFVSQEQKDAINELAFEVNAVFLRVAAATAKKHQPVVFMDPDPDWTDHRYCDEKREGTWLVEADAVNRSNSWAAGYYHPNTEGHVEMKNLLVRALWETAPGWKPVVQEDH